MNKKTKKMVKIASFALIVAICSFTFISGVNANWLGTNQFVSCGNINKIPARIPQIVSMLVNVAMVIIPILIVIFGVIDLVKGISSQKEEEIKKGQQTLIKRIVVGMLVFLIVMFTKLLVNFVADASETRDSIIDCIDCFINDGCGGSSSNNSSGNNSNTGGVAPSANQAVVEQGVLFSVPADNLYEHGNPSISTDFAAGKSFVVYGYADGGFVAHYYGANISYEVNSGFSESYLNSQTDLKKETVQRGGKSFDVYTYYSANYANVDVYYQFDDNTYIYAQIYTNNGNKSTLPTDKLEYAYSALLSTRRQ